MWEHIALEIIIKSTKTTEKNREIIEKAKMLLNKHFPNSL